MPKRRRVLGVAHDLLDRVKQGLEPDTEKSRLLGPALAPEVGDTLEDKMRAVRARARRKSAAKRQQGKSKRP